MLNPGFVTRPDAILPLIASFDIQQDAVIRRLMALRKIPLKILRNQQAQAAGDFGLHSFTLLKSSASELCYGLRGQFWRADFGLENVPDASAYQAPVSPGSAKLLLRYRVTELAPGQHELCTETFIYCPDRSTRLKMAAYWLAIRAGSGWIRRRTLDAVKSTLQNME